MVNVVSLHNLNRHAIENCYVHCVPWRNQLMSVAMAWVFRLELENIFFRVVLELSLTHWTAQIIRDAVVIDSDVRFVRIDFSLTYWVVMHGTPEDRLSVLSMQISVFHCLVNKLLFAFDSATSRYLSSVMFVELFSLPLRYEP